MTRGWRGLACLAVILGGCMPGSARADVSGLEGWRIQNGKWEAAGRGFTHDDPHSFGGALVRRDATFRDVTVEAAISIGKEYSSPGQTWAGFVIRASNAMIHGPWLDGYVVFIRPSGGVELQETGKCTVANAATDCHPDKRPVRLTVEARGTHIRVLVDGREVINATNSGFTEGDLALVSFSNAATFSDVKITGEARKSVLVRVAHTVPTPKAHPSVNPLLRVTAIHESGSHPRFFRFGGETYLPEGYDHTVLGGYGGNEHATFNTDVYDPVKMESVLQAMSHLGANAIRVWAWGGQITGNGYTGKHATTGLDLRYMENFVDFLRRCTAHGIYVIPVLDETPTNRYYDNVARTSSIGSADCLVSGYNQQYLTQWSIDAKKSAIRDFVGYVKRSDPRLLRTILGWELCNEACVSSDTGPFVYGSGKAVTATGTYDMASDRQRQACWDDGILHWANELTSAVKSVDPKAMVTVGMWTSDAQGRPPVNGIRNHGSDPRFCPRPSVLASEKCRIDFLDIHIYPWDGTSHVDRVAHEWEQVSKSGKPVVVGEYGITSGDPEKGKQILVELRRNAYALGYQGSLLWVWDLGNSPYAAVNNGYGELVAPSRTAVSR